jgi:hypothetical protein
MAWITDESGTIITDEAGVNIQDEAGAGSGDVPVGLQTLSIALNAATVNTGSAGLGLVSTVYLTLAINKVGGFGKTVSVNTLSMTLTLKSLSTTPSEISDWLKGQFQDWIIDFAA